MKNSRQYKPIGRPPAPCRDGSLDGERCAATAQYGAGVGSALSVSTDSMAGTPTSARGATEGFPPSFLDVRVALSR